MAKKASGLTIIQRKNGSWRAQIRKRGFPYETKEFLTQEAADDWGLRRLAEIQQTGQLADRRLSEKITFGKAIEAYQEEVTAKRRSEDSRISENARLNRFLREEAALCAYALAHLTPEMFEQWRDRRLTETVSRGSPYKAEIIPKKRVKNDGAPRKNAAPPKAPPKALKIVAPGTVKREMTLLKRVLDFARKKYKLAVNPLADRDAVERPVVHDERDVRLSIHQWSILLTACKQARNPWLYPFAELALEIGARRSSLLKLNWSDVRLSENTVVLRDVKNSTNPTEIRNVQVGLSPRAVEILLNLPRDLGGKVFPVTKHGIEQAFKRARERATRACTNPEDGQLIAAFHLHDVRHELASTLVEAGWEMVDVMAQGDWRDPKSLRRYYNARGKHLGSKLAKLDRKSRNP